MPKKKVVKRWCGDCEHGQQIHSAACDCKMLQKMVYDSGTSEEPMYPIAYKREHNEEGKCKKWKKKPIAEVFSALAKGESGTIICNDSTIGTITWELTVNKPKHSCVECKHLCARNIYELHTRCAQMGKWSWIKGRKLTVECGEQNKDGNCSGWEAKLVKRSLWARIWGRG